MDLSIIFPHHKTPELLCLSLDSIKKTVKKIKYEVFVADSETQEKTQALLREKYPNVKVVLFKQNAGYSKMVNAVLKKTKGDFILILNADIVVLEESIAKMLKYIKDHNNVGIVVPQLLDFTGNTQLSCFSNPSLQAILARRTFLGKTKKGKKLLSQRVLNGINSKVPKKVDWAQGSAMMVRKEAIKKVGLLDNRFFMYFEDADWCRRFWQKGYEVIYLPTAKMAHYYHRASKKWGIVLDIIFNKYTRIHIISALKYFWKYK